MKRYYSVREEQATLLINDFNFDPDDDYKIRSFVRYVESKESSTGRFGQPELGDVLKLSKSSIERHLQDYERLQASKAEKERLLDEANSKIQPSVLLSRCLSLSNINLTPEQVHTVLLTYTKLLEVGQFFTLQHADHIKDMVISDFERPERVRNMPVF